MDEQRAHARGIAERTRHVAVRRDPALRARVVRRLPMRYAEGADPALDRPDHLRAGSSIVWVGERLAVVQDDANFLALVDPASGLAEALPLPPGPDGRRLFDDGRANKALKLDLEASLRVRDGEVEVVIAFGSGSTSRREQVLVVRNPAGPAPRIELRPCPELYAALRSLREFSGSEMNIEGAALIGGRLRLFNRGNGAARGDHRPTDASCELEWPALWTYLLGDGAPPAAKNVVQYDLGELGGGRLSFTEATPLAGGATGGTIGGAAGSFLFTATAERSPDATRDGEVTGSVVGLVTEDRSGWAPLTDAAGRPLADKVEGIALHPSELRRAFLVIDRDDYEVPSELCEVLLEGPWESEK